LSAVTDVVLVATILVFFLLALLVVRACAQITAGALEDSAPEGSEADDQAPPPRL